MDPEVLVYVTFFIIVAIVQGIGQKRKEAQKRQRQQRRAPDAGSADEPAASREERASGRTGADSREETSSEELVPGDIWEEILGLARGETPGSRRPSGPTSPGEPGTATRTREVGADLEKGGGEVPSSAEEVPGRRDRVSVYRPPGSVEEIPEFEARTLEDLEPRKERTSREPVPTGPPPEGLGRPITEGRREPRPRKRRRRGGHRAELFPEGTVQELRKAVVLKEVLGPPVALREDEESF